jgi:hypothetical protein
MKIISGYWKFIGQSLVFCIKVADSQNKFHRIYANDPFTSSIEMAFMQAGLK